MEGGIGVKAVAAAALKPAALDVDGAGGLPPHKLHCSVLAEEAIKSAVKNYYDNNGIEYDPADFPEEHDCEACHV